MTLLGTLGVAVIGAGRMGADHVRRINDVISGARVAAVADLDEGRAAAAADGIEGCTVHTDPAAAMAAPGVAAVLIASPGPAHEAALLAAFERDLPVLCEKPLTPDPASALRVLAAEQRLGHRRVQVGFMRRYDADYLKLKRLLAEGAFGRTLMLHHKHRNVSTPPGFTNAMMIHDSAVHEIDVTRWLLDDEITSVRVLRPAPSGAAPGGLGDPQLILFETAGGRVVDTELFVNCGFGYQVTCEAVGERGTARIGDERGVFTNADGRWGTGIVPGFVERFEEAYDRQVRRWVEAIRRGEVEGPSCWDGYAAAAVCEAGVRAQATGERVPVDLVERPALYR
ncbi:Gfo/Idh/MocA family protein [Streptomyces varsoviensis]|uniref:Inositol 2-dehydrogenase n=1 Tax=Streptomyces varsoviensis TaxID=67373 RepID=A0ABR5J5I1_9ACTN|nr:Gfo/Idh/MocA family oxidoreductase [Streptomyces varsoviensis]KOG88645.1 inositol 2-dehydrogenase [Streptomyces varsoviensis]